MKEEFNLSMGSVLVFGLLSLFMGIPAATKLVEFGVNPWIGALAALLVFVGCYVTLAHQAKKLTKKYGHRDTQA